MIGFHYPDETVVYVKNKILNGWTILEADFDFFKKIEDGIYPPRTKKNEGFEIHTFGWAGKIFAFALLKKTPELNKFIKEDKDKFNSLVLIRLVKAERLSAAVDVLGYRTKQEKSDFVSNYFENLCEYMEKGKVTRKQMKSGSKLKKKKTPKKKRKSISKSIRHEVFKRDNYKCVECGATKEKTVLHIDHIIPVFQGGSDELDNLQTLCEACNLAKSNRTWKGGN